MKGKRNLVILHIDGLSYSRLLEAIEKGYMPTMKRLMDKEDYQPLRYRTGLPSTTPFAQAGILYGDNYNIPSFTWFDKEAGLVIRFGQMSSFSKVAHKYFKNTEPITKHGATIATCYPADADETFALAYNDPKSKTKTKYGARASVWVRWLYNPLHILDWLRFTIIIFFAYFIKLIQVNISGEHVAYKYFFAQLAQEIILHHMTRYAVAQAMSNGYSVIYAAFYAYDDASHAFGPDNKFCFQLLRQVDRSIRYVDKKRLKARKQYELLILSDHGQVNTTPFMQRRKKHFGEVLSELLPTYDIREIPGKHVTPKSGKQDGEIVLTYSGGLGHLYFRGLLNRASLIEVEKKYPGIVKKVIKMKEIECLLFRNRRKNILITKKKTFDLSKKTNKDLCVYLAKFDEPKILLRQLIRLNSFSRAGDIIFFGAFIDGKQINFENQFGGHGSIGGDQIHPFIFVKKSWNISSKGINGAEKVYYVIRNIMQNL